MSECKCTLSHTCDTCWPEVQQERDRCKAKGKNEDYNCQNEGTERYDNDGIYISKCCDFCWHKHVGPKYNCYHNPNYHHDPTFAGEALDPDEY